MWWLGGADGPLPIGDLIFAFGCIILGGISMSHEDTALKDSILLDEIKAPEADEEEDTSDNAPTDKPQPTPPDIPYPGNDPTVPPGPDYEWHGRPPIGGDKGAWVNRTNGISIHPDLNHLPPKGPHYDVKDLFGTVWSLFENGEMIIWR